MSRKHPTLEDTAPPLSRVEQYKRAKEAKAIMEKRWAMPGVQNMHRPCQWYSQRFGNPKCGYHLDPDWRAK